MKYRFFLLGLALLVQNLLIAQNDEFYHVKLLFTGDIMGHEPQIRSAEIKRNELYDYTPCFKYIKPLLQSADLAIGNLELTLPGKPPYTGYPTFKSPDELALALKDAGFDILVTANNHANDSGKDGVTHTIETLLNYGFYHTGTFRSPEERDVFYPLIVYQNNIKLAFLNYTYDTNGIPTREPTIVNLIDTAQIRKDMTDAHALNPDIIIVIMHWGLEYQLKENAVQQQLAQFLFQQGADLVIGSHPHVVQPIKEEPFTKEDGTEGSGLVVYSLGNFISNQTQANTDGGIMFEIELLKSRYTGGLTFGNYRYIPVWRLIQKDKSGKATYYTLPVADYEEDPNTAPGLTPLQWQALKTFAKNTRNRVMSDELMRDE